jgi:hypothetical protein
LLPVAPDAVAPALAVNAVTPPLYQVRDPLTMSGSAWTIVLFTLIGGLVIIVLVVGGADVGPGLLVGGATNGEPTLPPLLQATSAETSAIATIVAEMRSVFICVFLVRAKHVTVYYYRSK